MANHFSNQLEKTTGLVEGFRKYSEGATKAPLPYIKATIILGFIIILILLTLAICYGNPTYYQIIFFAFLITIIIILIMSFHLNSDTEIGFLIGINFLLQIFQMLLIGQVISNKNITIG